MTINIKNLKDKLIINNIIYSKNKLQINHLQIKANN